MAERFTPLYEWIAALAELTLAEKLVLCRVRMWPEGCFESYLRMAKFLGLTRRSVIRAVNRLTAQEWIIVRRRGPRKRILYFNFNRLSTIPLFDTDKVVSELHHLDPDGDRISPGGVRMSPKVVSECHHSIYSQDSEETLEKTLGEKTEILAALMTTHDAEGLSPTEMQQRKVELLRQIGAMRP